MREIVDEVEVKLYETIHKAASRALKSVTQQTFTELFTVPGSILCSEDTLIETRLIHEPCPV